VAPDANCLLSGTSIQRRENMLLFVWHPTLSRWCSTHPSKMRLAPDHAVWSPNDRSYAKWRCSLTLWCLAASMWRSTLMVTFGQVDPGKNSAGFNQVVLDKNLAKCDRSGRWIFESSFYAVVNFHISTQYRI